MIQQAFKSEEGVVSWDLSVCSQGWLKCKLVVSIWSKNEGMFKDWNLNCGIYIQIRVGSEICSCIPKQWVGFSGRGGGGPKMVSPVKYWGYKKWKTAYIFLFTDRGRCFKVGNSGYNVFKKTQRINNTSSFLVVVYGWTWHMVVFYHSEDKDKLNHMDKITWKWTQRELAYEKGAITPK